MYDKALYDAMNDAADTIDRYPHKFNFASTSMPKRGSQACAIGHTLDQLNAVPHENWGDYDVEKFMGVQQQEFYDRMDKLNPTRDDWREHADVAAKTMRHYAKVYISRPMQKISKALQGVERAWI